MWEVRPSDKTFRSCCPSDLINHSIAITHPPTETCSTSFTLHIFIFKLSASRPHYIAIASPVLHPTFCLTLSIFALYSLRHYLYNTVCFVLCKNSQQTCIVFSLAVSDWDVKTCQKYSYSVEASISTSAKYYSSSLSLTKVIFWTEFQFLPCSCRFQVSLYDQNREHMYIIN